MTTTSSSVDFALLVEHVGKAYKQYASPRQRFKALLTGRALYHDHWALRDVSFTLRRGQCLGLVGPNGAGKSTLLKLVTQTLQPSQGRIVRQGRLTAILELGAGFHPDFTGRMNLHFGASLLGISQEEMAQLESQVLEFADIGEAIDRPVKTYSSGMTVRLAFALVTAVEPDILIIDEALAVGDQGFQKKCVERIEQFRRNGCSILFCSHSQYHIRMLCDVALWLDQGQVQALGDTTTVLAAYEERLRQQEARITIGSSAARDDMQRLDELPSISVEGRRSNVQNGDRQDEAQAALKTEGGASSQASNAAGSVHWNGVLRMHNGMVAQIMRFEVPDVNEHGVLDSTDLVLHMDARAPEGEQPVFAAMIEQLHGVGVTSVQSLHDGAHPALGDDGLWHITLRFPALPLNTGQYVLGLYLFDASGLIVYEEWLHCLIFRFHNPRSTPGIVQLPRYWE